MKNLKVSVVTIALLVGVSGCGGGQGAGPGPSPPPPVLNSFKVTVTEIEVVNKDSGAALVVEGLPLTGGETTIE